MPLWRSRKKGAPVSLDEFLGDGNERSASPFDLSVAARDWQKRLGQAVKTDQSSKSDLGLPAFTLLRGGDMFERPREQVRARTDPELLSAFADEQLHLVPNKAKAPEREAALRGVLRVIEGNPALCKRMLIGKLLKLVIIPSKRDFRDFGFPPNTNPRAAGIFWNSEREDTALIGLREEHILEKPWLMVHEMTHAVHLLGLTKREREIIDQVLMPVYRSKRWVEEAMAIYAERAFGAEYSDLDLQAPDLYGKTRREWHDRHVFALFMSELMRPA